MARRYRYAFARKKEAKKGKLAVGLAATSFLILLTAAILSSILREERFGVIIGCMGLFGAVLSVYGFFMGLLSFQESGRKHRSSIVGSISCGILMVIWVGLYLIGVG